MIEQRLRHANQALCPRLSPLCATARALATAPTFRQLPCEPGSTQIYIQARISAFDSLRRKGILGFSLCSPLDGHTNGIAIESLSPDVPTQASIGSISAPSVCLSALGCPLVFKLHLPSTLLGHTNMIRRNRQAPYVGRYAVVAGTGFYIHWLGGTKPIADSKHSGQRDRDQGIKQPP